MTAREFAKAIDRPYPTVAYWLQNDKIPGATSLMVGEAKFWQIPETAVKNFKPPTKGRPPGSKNKAK